MFEFIVIFLSGLLAGILGGLLGIGGGVIIMPVLRFVIGIPTPTAIGTTAVAVFCTTLSGGYKHVKLGHVNLKSLIPIIITGAISSIIFSILFIW